MPSSGRGFSVRRFGAACIGNKPGTRNRLVETAGGLHYIATEYIEGQTLRKHLALARRPLAELVDIGIQVAGALADAHAAGITHRDIKPENIMVRPSGLVKVLDFGLAKLAEKQTFVSDVEAVTIGNFTTNDGTIMGTCQYMSPEQIRGMKVDARSDIYSLGILLYEMIAGERPLQGETASHVTVAILEKEPLPLSRPTVPAELVRMLPEVVGVLRSSQEPSQLKDVSGFHRLVAGGVMYQTTGNQAAFACELYRRYLERHLRQSTS